MSGPLRVALLSPGGNPTISELADGLRARGHGARLIAPSTSGPVGAIELRLRRRGYLEHLTCVPLSYLALRRGEDQIAHVGHPAAVVAAVRWARETGRPFIFHYFGVGDHADLMARRRKLELMDQGARHAAAVVVTSDAAANAFRRWLGVEARVIAGDAGPEPWLDLYAELTP